MVIHLGECTCCVCTLHGAWVSSFLSLGSNWGFVPNWNTYSTPNRISTCMVQHRTINREGCISFTRSVQHSRVYNIGNLCCSILTPTQPSIMGHNTELWLWLTFFSGHSTSTHFISTIYFVLGATVIKTSSSRLRSLGLRVHW